MSAEDSGKPGVDASVDKEQGFLSHLVELRDRLLRMFLAVLVCFLALFPFANTIYSWMATPLLRHLPEGSSMIAIEVASPFLIPLKVVLMVSVFIAIPFIFYQVWAFIAPGLYLHERRLVLPLLVSSTLLFFAGVAFAFFVVFPLAFAFLTGFTPEGVQMMTDIGKYLDFVITIFFAFGIAFEVPVATVVLVLVGATTPDDLASKRPYVIVGAFVVGMLLTPPDIISQTLLAIPMWILFEIGIIASRSMMRRKQQASDAAESRESRESREAAAAAAAGTVGAYTGPATAADAAEEPRYRPMSDAEMDEELDRIEREEAGQGGDSSAADGPDRDGSDGDGLDGDDPDQDKEGPVKT